MSKIADTVEDRIPSAFLTAIDSIVALKVELAILSLNASFGRDAASLRANSQSGNGTYQDYCPFWERIRKE